LDQKALFLGVALKAAVQLHLVDLGQEQSLPKSDRLRNVLALECCLSDEAPLHSETQHVDHRRRSTDSGGEKRHNLAHDFLRVVARR
jgi:hypothetical protein